MVIALEGFMCCGKSSAGAGIARALSLPFHDLDVMVSESAGMTVGGIFSEFAEEGFRRMESAVLEEHVRGSSSDSVLALGGGTAIFNKDFIRRNCLVIYLKVSYETVVKRMNGAGQEERPLAASGDLEKLFYEREPVYASIADITIECDSLTIEETVSGCIAALSREKAKKLPPVF